VRTTAATILVMSVVSFPLTAPRVSATVTPVIASAPDVSAPQISLNGRPFHLLQEQDLIRTRLRARGLSDSDITMRLSHLSDEEIHDLALFIRSKKANAIQFESVRKSNP